MSRIQLNAGAVCLAAALSALAVTWIALAAAILSLGAITGLAILLNRPEVDRAP